MNTGKRRDRDPLEELVDRACGEQPHRSAPSGLKLRVMAEIERRAALPWWRRSFIHWPTPMRAGFVAASVGVIAASLSLTLWSNLARVASRLMAPVDGTVSALQSVAGSAVFVRDLLQHVGSALLGGISPWIFYGGVLGVGALYVVLAGLCAATYRSLYVAN